MKDLYDMIIFLFHDEYFGIWYMCLSFLISCVIIDLFDKMCDFFVYFFSNIQHYQAMHALKSLQPVKYLGPYWRYIMVVAIYLLKWTVLPRWPLGSQAICFTLGLLLDFGCQRNNKTFWELASRYTSMVHIVSSIEFIRLKVAYFCFNIQVKNDHWKGMSLCVFWMFLSVGKRHLKMY